LAISLLLVLARSARRDRHTTMLRIAQASTEFAFGAV